MLFWFVAIVLTAAVTVAVLRPILWQSPAQAPGRDAHDAEVYAAQLRELEADAARGAIAPEDALVARAEIGRRLLKATAIAAPVPIRHRGALTAAVFLVGLGIPAATLGAYLCYGSPALPDLPLSARLAVDPAGADLPTLVAQAEAKLAANPADGEGWDTLTPIYLRSGRPADAVRAVGEAIRLLGETPERMVARGEALAQAADGEVTDAAKASFERALALDPANLPARFFLALDLSQEDRLAEAGPAWRDLVARSPADAPWLEIANAAIADADKRVAASVPAVPGPDGADVAAAASMAPADRQAMIEGMVSQLADRLKTAPDDPEGWKRLIRSYTVLGDDARARSAVAEASAVFAAGTAERTDIERFATGLGLSAAPTTTQ